MSITYKLEINSKPKEDKTSGILLRITENRKHKRYSTGVFVFPKDFNKKAESGKWIRRTNPEYVNLNKKLADKITEAKDAESKLEKNNQPATAKRIISEVRNKNTDSFIGYFKEKVAQFKLTRSIGYYKHLNSKLNNLEAYQKEILFTEITVSFLNSYEAHLTEQGLNENSITSNLRAIRTILYKSYSEDRFEGPNPFLKKKLKELKADKERLSLNEIKKIEEAEPEKGSHLWHTKNYFLFAFYAAGIRIGDLMQLQWKNIQVDILSYKMSKTRENHEIPLIPKAQEILKLYRGPKSKPEDYIFPILDNRLNGADRMALSNALSSKNAIINSTLKDLADLAEIEKNLTFHISRHSFADMLRQKKTSIYDIKNLLGHSDIKVTQRYIKSFDKESSHSAMKDAFDI
jgi:integrase